MKGFVQLRGVALVAAAGLVVTLAFATSASAALPQSATCAKLSSPPLKNGKSTGVLSSCTPAALAAGATSAFTPPPAGSKKGSLTGTYTWKNGKGATIVLVTFALQTARGKCPVGTTLVAVTGKVTGGSGAAAKIIKKGEPFTSSICATTSGAQSGKTVNEPGTKIKM
jgi:hypothetical protein